jgi:hypothetical protein
MQQSPQLLNGAPTANITTEQIQKVPIILLCVCVCVWCGYISAYLCMYKKCACLYRGCLRYTMQYDRRSVRKLRTQLAFILKFD